ncbi:unnamed protein product [Urochloa decumbens]|uniref:KIB1-4 beta-propeller domain-containing protein n=1 Tax=Urochloa decumbens TaxID=240449 RepID=A0ABC8ZC91_9POAL
MTSDDGGGDETASPPAARVAGWASLPVDLLVCVCQRLSAVPERVCFRAACRSWKAAAADLEDQDQRAAARMPPPWVVIPHGAGCCSSFTLLSVPTNQAFSWSPPGGGRLRCVGASGGWIAGAHIDGDRGIRVSLLNPLTGARVDVPATVGWAFFNPADPRMCYGGRVKEEISMCRTVHKVAFSPNPTEHDFAVAVVTRARFTGGKAVGFTRASCRRVWCAIADLGTREPGGDYKRDDLDVAYHGGKFYCMTMSAEVWVVDMAAPRPSPAPLARFAAAPGTPPGLDYDRHHLAFTGDDGALHVVCSSIRRPGEYMLVQRYDPSCCAEDGPSASPQWTQVTSLRGHAFLVGDMNQTMSVRADGGDEEAWLRPDSVYFTNIPLCTLFAESRRCSEGGAWVLDLASGDIRRPPGEGGNYRAMRGWSLQCYKCVWIMPSMR